MTIKTLIDNDFVALRTHDFVATALTLIAEQQVRHLPVVSDDGKLVGLLSEATLLDADQPGMTIASLVGLAPVYAGPDNHVFEVTRMMIDHSLTVVPVADEFGTFHGTVKRQDIFEQFARMLSTHEPGSILALEIDEADYSLAKLLHAIEQNDARVLSVATESPEYTGGPIHVTLKLNVRETARVRHVLEHEGYYVVAAFNEDEDEEELQRRIQEFMKYLEV